MASKEKKEVSVGELPLETSFWVNDGQVVRSILDLPGALKRMSKNTFKYHVNKEKNDLANWVRDVIGDDRLAHDLSKTKSRKASLQLVSKKVSELKI